MNDTDENGKEVADSITEADETGYVENTMTGNGKNEGKRKKKKCSSNKWSCDDQGLVRIYMRS